MRTKQAPQRAISPDPVYGSVLVHRLINRVMQRGKKNTATSLVYAAFDMVKEKTKQNPLEVFEQALQNITPKIEVRSRRVGGAAYQVPVPVRGKRASSLAIRWLISESNKRSNKEYKKFSEKLAAEIVDATQEEGGAIQKKLNSHKMADANKAFAHFRW